MSASQAQSDTLASMNSATLGANMPVISLANGKQVQTGTVGALLVNIKAYDELIRPRDTEVTATDSAAGDQNIGEKLANLEERFKAAIPLLRDVGLLDLFPPREWIAVGENGSTGRRRVGELILEIEKHETR